MLVPACLPMFSIDARVCVWAVSVGLARDAGSIPATQFAYFDNLIDQVRIGREL